MRWRAIRGGEGIACIAALLLFVSTFLNWFGTRNVQEGNLLGYLNLFGPRAQDAWQALDFLPLLILTTGTTALMAFVMRLGRAPRKVLAPTDASVALLGIVSACLILGRINNPPIIVKVVGQARLEDTASIPIYLAVALSAAVSIGAVVALCELGLPRSRPRLADPGEPLRNP